MYCVKQHENLHDMNIRYGVKEVISVAAMPNAMKDISLFVLAPGSINPPAVHSCVVLSIANY